MSLGIAHCSTLARLRGYKELSRVSIRWIDSVDGCGAGFARTLRGRFANLPYGSISASRKGGALRGMSTESEALGFGFHQLD